MTLAWHGTAPAIGYCVLATAILAIVLIDLGDLRAPLAVAAIGTTLGDLILIATVWPHDWSTLLGAQIGVVVGSAAFASCVTAIRSAPGPTSTGGPPSSPSAAGSEVSEHCPAAVGLPGEERPSSSASVSPADAVNPGSTCRHHRADRIASMTDVALRRPLVVAVVAAATSSLLAFR